MVVLPHDAIPMLERLFHETNLATEMGAEGATETDVGAVLVEVVFRNVLANVEEELVVAAEVAVGEIEKINRGDRLQAIAESVFVAKAVVANGRGAGDGGSEKALFHSEAMLPGDSQQFCRD